MSTIGLALSDRMSAGRSGSPAVRAAASADLSKHWVYVVFRGDAEAIRRAGFAIESPYGTIGHAYLTADKIERLAQHEDVVSIDLPPRPEPKLDRSVPDIHAPAAWNVVPLNPANSGKGRGAVCGFIDGGFDVFHGSLRKDNGDTRVLFYWDQTFAYDAAGRPIDSRNNPLAGDDLPLNENDTVATPDRGIAVSGNPIGIEFDSSQIDTALARHSDGKGLPISLRDDGGEGHGTHVSGTAVGDGSDRDRCTAPFTYQGVAPEADLIVVKTGFSDTRLSNVIAAMDYIFAKAQSVGRPCAINISFGSHGAPHNGFSAEALAIDAAVAGTPGRAVVVAASNEREVNIHAAETVAGGTTTRINLVIEACMPVIAIFGSYDLISTLTFRLRLPGPLPPPPDPVPAPPQRSTQVFDPTSVAIQEPRIHGHVFRSAASPSAPGDPDRHFAFVVTRDGGGTLEAGTWQVDLINASAVSSNVHLWLAQPAPPDFHFRPAGFQPVVPVANPSAQDIMRPAAWRRPENWISGTMVASAAARSAITVAGYDPGSINTPIGYFSSQGPVPRDLSLGLFPATAPDKPDIAAPGVAIHAPFANQRKPCFLCCECWVIHHKAMEGTSMASPHVAGVAALMFAQDPALGAEDVKRIMKQVVRTAPILPAGWPVSDVLFGAGLIDAVNCVVLARASAEARLGGGTPVPPSPFLIAPQPVRHPWQDFEERFRAWERIFGKRPAWQLGAFLVSTHFDEVKRLIDTNRRVAAVWQRHGGPELVRRIVLSREDPDPPLPERIDDRPVLVLMDKLVAMLERYGSAALKADAVRYRDFVRRLPGLRIADIDTALAEGLPS